MSMSQPRDPRTLRVSHADRDRVVEILREAAGDGRLDAQELDERVERALTARTFAELEPLTEDLPVPPLVPPPVGPAAPGPVSAPGSAGPPVADAVDAAGSVTWSVHGIPLRREGVWTVPRVIELDVHGGSARLDYTMARLPEGGASEIRVSVHGGSVRLTVPPGVAVDASGLCLHGGAVRDRSLRQIDPSRPVTHVITVAGSVHGGSVRVQSSLHGGTGRRSRIAQRRADRRERWFGADPGAR